MVDLSSSLRKHTLARFPEATFCIRVLFRSKTWTLPKLLHLGAMWPFEGAGHQTDGTHMEGSDAVGVGEAQGDGPFDLGQAGDQWEDEISP